MTENNRSILQFAAFGLVGPGLAELTFALENDTFLHLALALWPTWHIGWLAMAMPKSIVPLALSVAANVVVFSPLGYIFRKVTLNQTPRFLVVAMVYLVMYGAIEYALTL